VFSRVLGSSPVLAALSPGVGPLEAPPQWDVGAWGVATSVGFGLLGCWLSWHKGRSAARERSEHWREKLLLRFVVETLKLELATHSLATARRAGAVSQIDLAMRDWHNAATNVHILARQHIGFEARRDHELRTRIAAAQAHYELSRVAIERGKSAADATFEFHRSAERVNHVATALRAIAEHMADRP
jgi:hypothetical protein